MQGLLAHADPRRLGVHQVRGRIVNGCVVASSAFFLVGLSTHRLLQVWGVSMR